MKKILWGLALFASAFTAQDVEARSATQSNVVTLGTVDQVTNWYSYPNNCSVICFRDWTLEETVAHYVTQSVTRDGYSSDGLEVTTSNGNVVVTFGPSVPQNYGSLLTTFLQTGQLAFDGAQQINAQGQWAYDWLFFLPHGMALENHKTLELLHFPPDYSLTKVQDYLISNTTDRWNVMLEENGVEQDETPLFQTIVDLAPIAAPSNAGSTLSATYSYFSTYAQTMLENWTATDTPNVGLPMVAFGSPVRSWVNSTFGVDIDVNTVATVTLKNGSSVPVLGSNHPSRIFYADPGWDDPNGSSDDNGFSIMMQDATSSCWQARMGEQPSLNAQDTLNTCAATWAAQPTQVCEMYYEQVQDKTPSQAAQLCANTQRDS